MLCTINLFNTGRISTPTAKTPKEATHVDCFNVYEPSVQLNIYYLSEVGGLHAIRCSSIKHNFDQVWYLGRDIENEDAEKIYKFFHRCSWDKAVYEVSPQNEEFFLRKFLMVLILNSIQMKQKKMTLFLPEI